MRMLKSIFLMVLLSIPCLAAATESSAAQPAQAFSRPDQKILDQMIGDWDVDYAIYDEHGNIKIGRAHV